VPTHICIYPEDLVKMGPVYSEIIAPKGTLKNKESNIRKNISPAACNVGWFNN